jgi:hypothetical protein
MNNKLQKLAVTAGSVVLLASSAHCEDPVTPMSTLSTTLTSWTSTALLSVGGVIAVAIGVPLAVLGARVVWGAFKSMLGRGK